MAADGFCMSACTSGGTISARWSFAQARAWRRVAVDGPSKCSTTWSGVFVSRVSWAETAGQPRPRNRPTRTTLLDRFSPGDEAAVLVFRNDLKRLSACVLRNRHGDGFLLLG